MVPGSLARTLRSKIGFVESKVSPTYTLNKGHVYFFYNKGLYLEKRYKELVDEMKARGFSPDPDRKFPSGVFPKELFNDWVPTEREKNIARERIALRISQKPGWYKMTPSKKEE